MSTSSTPGKEPAGRADRMWECALADGQAMPCQRSRGALAAFAVRAVGLDAVRGLPAAEPAGVLERDAEGDGVAALVGARVDLGHAEVGAARGVGVIVMLREPVRRGEPPAAGPLAAHP